MSAVYKVVTNDGKTSWMSDHPEPDSQNVIESVEIYMSEIEALNELQRKVEKLTEELIEVDEMR